MPRIIKYKRGGLGLGRPEEFQEIMRKMMVMKRSKRGSKMTAEELYRLLTKKKISEFDEDKEEEIEDVEDGGKPTKPDPYGYPEDEDEEHEEEDEDTDDEPKKVKKPAKKRNRKKPPTPDIPSETLPF